MRKRTAGIVATLVCMVFTLTGCIELWVLGGLAAGGTAVGLYMSGEREVIGRPLAEVREATALALEKVGDGVIEQSGGETHAEFDTHFADDGTSLSVNLSSVSDSATKCRVWVGILGDPSRSQLVLDEIKAQLRLVDEAGEAAVPEPAGL